MAERRPLCIVGNGVQELPVGDTLPGGGGGSITWTIVTTNTTMTSGVPYVAEGALDMTLPATAAGEWFFVYAADAEVRIVSNGNVINRVGSGNDLTMQAGESAYLVARSAGNLEIVQ